MQSDVLTLEKAFLVQKKQILELSEKPEAYLILMPNELEFIKKYKEEHPNWRTE
jgi:hypothetical protein